MTVKVHFKIFICVSDNSVLKFGHRWLNNVSVADRGSVLDSDNLNRNCLCFINLFKSVTNKVLGAVKTHSVYRLATRWTPEGSQFETL
jgi:hypothetical protein